MPAKVLVAGSAGLTGPQENNSNRSPRQISAARAWSSLSGSIWMVVTLVVWAGFAAITAPAFADDVAHGAQLAQQWCIGCHVLPDHPGQTALQGPPSFCQIAGSGKTSDQLRVFLLQPHGAMPPLSLSRAEIDDLLGYIATLR